LKETLAAIILFGKVPQETTGRGTYYAIAKAQKPQESRRTMHCRNNHQEKQTGFNRLQSKITKTDIQYLANPGGFFPFIPCRDKSTYINFTYM
jgi:hypothetical protein